MSQIPPAGRLAGIDYGTVRIGVAVCDPQRILASPLETYTRCGDAEDAVYFRHLVAEHRLVGFIVGLPVHASGEESQKSREARRFGEWLVEVTNCPVQFYDERFTTREATNLLGPAQLSRKQRKRRLDMVAAQLVLAGFLESSGQSTPPGPLADA